MPNDSSTQYGSIDSPFSMEVEPYLPDSTPVMFADGLIIAHGNGVWHLSFLQSEAPLVTTPSTIPKSVRARCVVRIVVADDRIPDFLRALLSTAARSKILEFPPDEEAQDGE